MYLEDIQISMTVSISDLEMKAAWASAFSNEIGFIDNDCFLQNYFDFYMNR